MPHFLFQPDPVDGVEFRPVRVDMHREVIKIVDEEIHHDVELNNTDCVVVGTGKKTHNAKAESQRGGMGG